MKTFGLLFCSLFAAALGFAQGFNAVHSPNGNDVWAVGRGGNVFHSFDGGVTWASDGKGTSDLRGVYSMGSKVWLVGDGGNAWKTDDGGLSWSQMAVGTVSLRAVAFINQNTGWAVGANGTILKTLDGGSTWLPQASGTTVQLNAIAFVDSMVGYAVGNNGTMLKTNTSGRIWTNMSGAGWTKNLTSVAAKNQKVYVTGVDAFCARSNDGGTSWSRLNFNTDVQSDVNDVFLKTEDNAFFIGGGGYIRESSDAGATFRWAQHPLHAVLSDICFYDNLRGWAATEKYNVVMRTTDGGITWLLPQGTTVNMQWQQKSNAGGAIGNGFAINPWDKNKIYCALGRFIYMSADRGDTWVQTATISPTSGSTHVLAISAKDTNVWAVAFTGGGDHIRRSTDRGLTWTTTISIAFSAFGMPLEQDGSHPDTLYFAPEDGHVYRSTNFAQTWIDLGPKGFTSPCDFQVVRDNPNILWCGDSGPSRISRSTDGGNTWTLVYNGSAAEIPTIANSSLQGSFGIATAWSSGGVQKTTNYGATWTSTSGAGSAWGCDIAKDDPNVPIFGVYGGGQAYISTNGGGTFTTSALSGSNYGILAYDRATVIAEQSGGLWKLVVNYTVPTSNQQVVSVVAPNGGENWNYSSIRNITWTAANFASVKIEYKTSPTGAWQTIAASVPSTSSPYAWTIPNAPSSQARVRISDATDGFPSDTSDGVFSITVANFAANPNSIAFGAVGINRVRQELIQITNAGTAPLVISSATTNTSNFIAARTSFTIPAGQTDTLGVNFRPTAVRDYVDTLRLGTNAPIGVARIPLSGNGILAAAVTVTAPNGGEQWRAGTVQNVRWNATLVDQVTLQYRILPTVVWRTIATNVPAAPGQYAWTVPNYPAQEALVRAISSSDGTVQDESDSPFMILSPTDVVQEQGMPATFELAQNYPNPFNPSTKIIYGIPKESRVKLTVFDALGQELAVLVDQSQPAGRFSVEFSTASAKREMSSGIYYYRIEAGDFVQTKKLILLK